MRLLFLFLSYPDASVTSNMYTELVSQLSVCGHEVRVVAPDFKGPTRATNEAGIHVLRVHSGPVFKTAIIIKGINTMLLNGRFQRALLKSWPDWRPDWVVTSTPPITLAPLLKLIRKRTRTRTYLMLRDIFPQNAKDIGLLCNPLLIAYLRLRERQLYRESDIIGCMSPGNIEYLRAHHPRIPVEKLQLFPNWIRPTGNEDAGASRCIFRKRFQLGDKFIAVFGGNLGLPQHVDFILDLAHKVAYLEDVVFCIIGDGSEKARITNEVQSRQLSNVRLFDRLNHQEYQAFLRETDLGLVNLSAKFTIPNIPSRTLAYWDANLPVLAATDRNTDYKVAFLDKYQGGLWAETGDIDAYCRQFLKLYSNPELRKTMGENGRRAVLTEFCETKAAYRMIDQMNRFSNATSATTEQQAALTETSALVPKPVHSAP